jgi:hypothetical protein
MKIDHTVLLVVFVSSMIIPAVGATPALENNGIESTELSPNDHIRTKNFTSTYGVEHSATLDTENDTIVVRSYNPTDQTKGSAGYTVSLYNRTLETVDKSLEPGERSKEKFRFNDTLSITRTNHTVYVSGWGDNATAKITFTKEIGTDNPERYPVPEIVDAELVEDPPEKLGGLYLAVTVENLGEQSYTTYMWVHTNQTDGQRAPARVTRGKDRTTWYVPLEEDPSDHVQGEIRLYRGSVKNDSGIRDQVYFEGTLDGETEIRHEEFEPITPPYEEGAYEYGDGGAESSEEHQNGPTLGNRVVSATAIAFLVFVAVAGVLGLFFRLR